MKKSLLILTLLTLNLVSAQKYVPTWIKDALPVTKKHLRKVEKKGDKYLKKYKNAEEGSLEKKIYYRIKYIDYLKSLLELDSKISSVGDSNKPFPFKIFVSGNKRVYLKELSSKKGFYIKLDDEVKIEKDTLLNVTDLFSNSSFVNGVGYLPHQKGEIDSHYKVVVDYAGKKYELKNSYDYYSIKSFPNFNKWKEKYYVYSEKFNDSLKSIVEKNAVKEKVKQDSLKKIREAELKKVKCITKIDDFTGEIIVKTNQKRLVVLENEAVKERANELWNKGIYVDYEIFVFAVKGVKKGKNVMLDVYTKHKTTKPLSYYGLMVKGSAISFKLENGKVLNLKLLNTVSPEINFKNKYSYYENILELTQSDILQLKASPVTKIRINYSKGYKDYEVNDNSDALSKIVECIK